MKKIQEKRGKTAEKLKQCHHKREEEEKCFVVRKKSSFFGKIRRNYPENG